MLVNRFCSQSFITWKLWVYFILLTKSSFKQNEHINPTKSQNTLDNLSSDHKNKSKGTKKIQMNKDPSLHMDCTCICKTQS